MIENENMRVAESLALNLLRAVELPTTDIIKTTVGHVLIMLRGMHKGEGINENDLIRSIETKCSVFVLAASTLEDTRDHFEWLLERRDHIDWRFWNRYRVYLEDVERLPPSAVERLNEVTDQILRRLENPLRIGAWDRRGMVVGQVQSGKTANYTGLICKAADAGYHFIVVLAGSHNSLRSQTQRRLDRDFLGFDTQQKRLFDQSNTRIGVGRLPGVQLYIAHSLTNSADNGDFNMGVAKKANLMIGGAEPVLLVVKKNASVLRNLIKWATSVLIQHDPASGRRIVQGVPLLLIDDEADNASINTNTDVDDDGLLDPDLDPSKINGLIRKLLHSFEKTAYVGYTATPFANIFIAEDMLSEEFGQDLFPRSFIINLSPPSNYLGPARVFGMVEDRDAGIEETDGLPIIRQVTDYEAWIPDGHKKDLIPGELPLSIKEALKAFILTCAARFARGAETAHNSMLIHVTRFVAVQGHVARQVEDELKDLRLRLRFGDGKYPHPLMQELRELWDRDFQETTRAFEATDATPIGWEQVARCLDTAAAKIEVRKINGSAKDTLQYEEHRSGLSIICIGGDKLSRGLTLEGLSISYYLRASRMYDTLMQMGRWFGYRPGYADLCRLYTTKMLVKWYRDIASADEELRRRFEDMAALDRTPMDYGLAIRNHPDGLMITAPNKMRHGQKVFVSFAQTIIETITFYEQEATNHANLVAADQLLRQAVAQCRRKQNYDGPGTQIWEGASGQMILDFLGGYTTHAGARKARAEMLERYIRSRVADGDLTEWTIALIGNRTAEHRATIGGSPVGLIQRNRVIAEPGLYTIRRLISPSDEFLDLTEDEKKRAVAETQESWRKNPGRSQRIQPPTEPTGPVVRRIRPNTRGLLLLYPLDPVLEGQPVQVGGEPVIGFGISFPRTDRTDEGAIEYTANRIYLDELYGGDL